MAVDFDGNYHTDYLLDTRVRVRSLNRLGAVTGVGSPTLLTPSARLVTVRLDDGSTYDTDTTDLVEL